MKNFIYSLMLGSLLTFPAWGESDSLQAESEDSGLKIEINMDDDSDKPMTEEELETKIKGKVFSIIGDIIEAASDDLTDEEKAEIKEDIKDAIAEIKEIETVEDETVIRPKIHVGGDDDSLEFIEFKRA